MDAFKINEICGMNSLLHACKHLGEKTKYKWEDSGIMF